jgi:NAD(P)-dependent dehydrogenase (short-subunit alcohol dehydrogenase family)
VPPRAVVITVASTGIGRATVFELLPYRVLYGLTARARAR